MQMKINIESQSDKQNYITGDEFISDEGHGCFNYI